MYKAYRKLKDFTIMLTKIYFYSTQGIKIPKVLVVACSYRLHGAGLSSATTVVSFGRCKIYACVSQWPWQ